MVSVLEEFHCNTSVTLIRYLAKNTGILPSTTSNRSISYDVTAINVLMNSFILTCKWSIGLVSTTHIDA